MLHSAASVAAIPLQRECGKAVRLALAACTDLHSESQALRPATQALAPYNSHVIPIQPPSHHNERSSFAYAAVWPAP